MNDPPLVTVLIPARNEEADIERCLRAVLAQDHPHDRMEVVLVDGGSTDETVAIGRRVLNGGDISWKVVYNPAGTTPSNLNAGLAVSSSDVVCRIDARSIVPPDYVRLCSDVLRHRPDVSVTGGAQIAQARDDSARSVGIARALNNRYSMGGSRYRAGASSGATDTVYLGAFRSADLRDTGGWDEAMRTNQDFELNRRLGRDGVVWFDARLEVGYVPRQTLGALVQQYYRFGRWKVRYWRRTGDPPRTRQWIPVVAVMAGGAAALLLLVRSRRRGRTALILTVASVGLLVGIDEAGAASPADVHTRAVATCASALVVASWVAGIVAEALRPSPPDGARG